MTKLKIKKQSQNLYLIRTFFSQCKTFLRFLVSSYVLRRDWERNKEKVNEIYEKLRTEKKENISNLSLENYVFGEDKLRWTLFDNRLSFGSHKSIHKRKLDIFEDIILKNDLEQIIEFGSGDGRNILWLAKKFPNLKFIGLELSQASVELSDIAAAKYALDNVSFFKIDLTDIDSYIQLLDKKTFVFTNHTLEEMPRIFNHPLEALKRSEVRKVALIEPAYIFSFSRVILDVSRILRIIYHDRLSGLIRFCKKNLSTTFDMEVIDLGIGINPVNPSSLIILSRKTKE